MNVRKKLFMIRMIRHWNRLSKEVMNVPYWETSNAWGSEQSGQAVDAPFYCGGVGLDCL